jgi:hypothetical protein
MWTRVVSRWMCTLLCGWSLLAPLAILTGLEIESASSPWFGCDSYHDGYVLPYSINSP